MIALPMFVQGAALIVEDEVLERTLMTSLVRSVDPRMRVEYAETAEAAVELMAHDRFDFVIADFRLAGKMTGVDLWRHCREARSLAGRGRVGRTPFLLVSGHTRDEILKSMKSGEWEPRFLGKPYSVAECRQAIWELMGEES